MFFKKPFKPDLSTFHFNASTTPEMFGVTPQRYLEIDVEIKALGKSKEAKKTTNSEFLKMCLERIAKNQAEFNTVLFYFGGVAMERAIKQTGGLQQIVINLHHPPEPKVELTKEEEELLQKKAKDDKKQKLPN